MQSVTLKGVKEGFILTLDESASFTDITEELNKLLERLKIEEEKGREKTKKVSLEIKTGNRLLSEKEKSVLIEAIKEKSQFSLQKVEANVLTYEQAYAWQQSVSLQMEVQTIRSGQILEAAGDVLLVGRVQPGGLVRAKGSIFIMGELLGVAHAGYDGDATAVVVANFQTKAQVRIADSVTVIENKSKENPENNGNRFAYINDLHILNFEQLENLKNKRPNLGKVTGGLV